jgi:hypothetical protein
MEISQTTTVVYKIARQVSRELEDVDNPVHQIELAGTSVNNCRIYLLKCIRTTIC